MVKFCLGGCTLGLLDAALPAAICKLETIPAGCELGHHVNSGRRCSCPQEAPADGPGFLPDVRDNAVCAASSARFAASTVAS